MCSTLPPALPPNRQPSVFKKIAAATGALLILSSEGFGATFRWASSSNRIYVEDGGSATLSDIKAALPNAPLDLVDAANKIWLLRANLLVVDGSTLLLHGAGADGDVNELRLLSNNSSALNSVVILEADWGTIDLQSTQVTSWNEAVSGPDTEYLVYKRACVRARSRIAGAVIQQSTLNVVNTEINHLGENDPERYGLTWQIVSSASGVRVFGEVSGSAILYCPLGVETWSVDDVSWSGNEISQNVLYGFKPSDPGHQALLAENNVHDNEFRPTFRWSGSNSRIYVTGLGSCTLSDIQPALPSGPLEQIDPANHIWHLRANIQIADGGELELRGPSIGGDVAELRLQSNNSSTANAFVWISAEWGGLDIRSTRITSWDDDANGPDTEHLTYKRAYIRVRSRLDSDGVTARESRMDIQDSDVGYLGFDGSEAYGVVWKVIGVHPDPTKDIFDYVEVYGDILNSHLHHNYFGMYSYGHFGGQWLNNEVDHNYGYGFDPHDDSDYLRIEDNDVHHNGDHGIIASKRCDHLTIRGNRVWQNDNNGIMLHRSCNDTLIENNEVSLNADSGIAVHSSHRTTVRNNLVLSNAHFGIRLSVGTADSLVEFNDVGYCGEFGFYLYEGTDPPEPGQDRRPKRNLFADNFVHDCFYEGIKLVGGDENEFIGNTFLANGPILRFANSTLTQFISNSIPTNVTVKLAGSPSVATEIYFSEQPCIKLQIDTNSVAVVEDVNGAVFDFDEGALFTAVDENGSFVTLSSAEIGTTTTIVRRNLLVSAGDAHVNPTSWELTGDLRKTWTAKAGLPIQTITYIVGDLAPDTVYNVLRDGLPLMSLSSDPNGKLSFWDVPGTIDPIAYSVTP